jgi:hypothetical protein
VRRQPQTENRYYAVVEPFTVEVRVGVAGTNIYLGRIQPLQDLYQTVALRPGDELHLLVGGDFLVRDGASLMFDTRRHMAHEVLLHPAPFDPDLPWGSLAEISRDAARRPAGGYRGPSFRVGDQPLVIA